jgi:hypothetical protein
MLPLDREQGLGPEELTQALAEIVEMLGVIAPFESAARVVEQTLGVQISGERVRRRTERTGAVCLVEAYLFCHHPYDGILDYPWRRGSSPGPRRRPNEPVSTGGELRRMKGQLAGHSHST